MPNLFHTKVISTESMMSDRGAWRGMGAPFYAAPRRKTSAEIISEARAAVYGAEMSGSSGVNSGGALRPLRTRRPFTPREPQRTLFADRARKKDTRPPSAFDLKHLTLTESSEEALVTIGARVAGIDEDTLHAAVLSDTYTKQSNVRKKPAIRNQSRSMQERSGDGWSGFTKLPHLSGRAKPLHRRSISQATPEESTAELDLSQSISISRPSGMEGEISPNGFNIQPHLTKSLSPDATSKRKVFAGVKSHSYETNLKTAVVDIDITHIDRPGNVPNTKLDYMSILELCDALSRRMDADRAVLLLNILQARLEENTPATSLRELVLRSLYNHIDSDDERVLVGIARAMLTMRVTGKHLSAACKLVFKIAKNDKNDHFFRDTNLIELLVEGCGRLEPVTESECCVYGAGALRVLALEPNLRARAVAAGAVHLAAIHLKILNAAKSESPRSVSEQCTHAVYQVTGALRNLASDSQGEEFLASGAIGELLAALLAHTDRDVLTNVARCLSVLSAQESCCAWLCGSGSSAHALLRALAACASRPPLAVRLAYTLGNMAATDDRARNAIYNEEGSIDVLLTILESYTKRNDEARDPDLDPDLHLIGTDLGGSDGSNEDVLIKTVRVVANLCLAERAGRGLAATYADRTVKALLACLKLAEKPAENSDCSEDQQSNVSERRFELAAASLATLNNITYYREPPDPPDPLDDTLDKICRATCGWLSRGGEASCEAARALGNLTRAPRVAQLFMLEGALDALTPFFDHDDGGVRCSAAGVLVNVCGASNSCGEAGEAAARALAAASRREDAGAAALLTRALWNAHAHEPLHATTAQHAARALHAFIDDESVFAPCEASKLIDRRASDPALLKYYVTFDDGEQGRRLSRAASAEFPTSEDEACSGDDLGFEDGDAGEACDCDPCTRLASWEELVAVAIPLLELLRPPRHDAAVGTD